MYSDASSAVFARSAFVPARLRVPLLGEGVLEPGEIDAHAVLGGELDGQVDRKAERVVEPERDVAGQHGRVGGQRLGLAADRRARPR